MPRLLDHGSVALAIKVGLLWFAIATVLLLTTGNADNPVNSFEGEENIKKNVPRTDKGDDKYHSELTKEEVASGRLIINQSDPRLLKYILRYHLTPPAMTGMTNVTPTNIVSNRYEQQEIYRYVRDCFKNQSGGFFIECGANDGEYFSNTLPLEIYQQWTGLLIESDPRPLKILLERKRKSWIANSCLSTTPHPSKLTMLRHDNWEGLSFFPGYRKFIGEEADYHKFEAQCFPLYSILTAINIRIVDYFSLDIEGAELGVLKTIPWDKLLIKLLSIEVHPEYVKPVRDYMTSVGYVYQTFIKNSYSHDQIYIHSSLV